MLCLLEKGMETSCRNLAAKLYRLRIVLVTAGMRRKFTHARTRESVPPARSRFPYII